MKLGTPFDIAVVGAGLAGLEVSRRLAERGFRVLLADRKRMVGQTVRTTGIFVRRTLESFDLPQDCLGPVVRHVTLRTRSGQRLELMSSRAEFRVGRMKALYEHELGRCQQLGVEWLANASFCASMWTRRGSIARFETPQGLREFDVRFIVGADGVDSSVAQDLGLDKNREWIVGAEDVFERVPLEGPPRFDCYLDADWAPGYIAWVVHDGEEVHLGVGGYPARFAVSEALNRFREFIFAHNPWRDARHVERRGGRIPVGGVLRRIASDRGLLVGDAAGAVSPLTAGGLDPCLRMSALAAEVITHYLNTDDAEALGPYEGNTFRRRFASRIWMRRLMKLSASQSLLETALAILRIRPFTAIASHVFFGCCSFPDVDFAKIARRFPATRARIADKRRAAAFFAF
ncbi:MAG: NAD(P)/FAD-dependent oxidoreductase [Verrucomicrobiae bacterium]|nr:NAD(P)/FAD-dependent oxidoreductase [Verrucomicrobiae bacterium]